MTFHLSLGGPGLPSANLPAGPGERKRSLERNPECSKAEMGFLGIEEKGVEIHRGCELRGLKILTAQE